MLLERARTAYQSWKTRPAGFSFAREGHRRTRRVREVTLPDDTLRLLSFNIQAGIGTSRSPPATLFSSWYSASTLTSHTA